MIVACRRRRAPLIPQVSRMVEAIDGRANDWPTTCLNGRDEFLGQRRLARRVHSINGDANGMRALDVHDTLNEFFQKLCSLHYCTIVWARPLTLPVSGGPQRKTPGIAPKACAVGRPLHWVVRPGWR